jgi:arsenite transporter
MDPTNDKRLESHGIELQDSTTTDHSNEKDNNDRIDDSEPYQSAFKGLGWLDRLLAVWILLAMIVGILLGNFVDSVGPALHRGELVGVSMPIGEFTRAYVRKHVC